MYTDAWISFEVGVKLKTFPFNFNLIASVKISKGGFKSALADIAERTHYIRPYFYFHIVCILDNLRVCSANHKGRRAGTKITKFF